MRVVEYTSLNRPSQPAPIILTVHFQTNGSPNVFAESLARDAIEKVLLKSGIYAPTTKASGAIEKLDIVINNVADIGGAMASGFGTGMTFGAAGSMVSDGYVMSINYEEANGKSVKREYKNVIFTTIENHSPPPNLVPMSSVSAAFDRVVEDMTLHMLLDLQQSGAQHRSGINL